MSIPECFMSNLGLKNPCNEVLSLKSCCKNGNNELNTDLCCLLFVVSSLYNRQHLIGN